LDEYVKAGSAGLCKLNIMHLAFVPKLLE